MCGYLVKGALGYLDVLSRVVLHSAKLRAFHRRAPDRLAKPLVGERKNLLRQLASVCDRTSGFSSYNNARCSI